MYINPQFFGVPQRRRRVFVFIGLRDWTDPASILFESQGLCGNFAPRREAGERATGTISARPTGGGGLGTDFDLDEGLIARAVKAGEMGHRHDPSTDNYIAFNNTGQGWWDGAEAAQTVYKGNDKGGGGARESTVVVAAPLTSPRSGAGGSYRTDDNDASGNHIVVQTRGSNVGVEDDLTGALGSNADRASGSAPMVLAFEPRSRGDDGRGYGDTSLEFVPGRYLAPGYTITSRGCPRRCWFCSVPKRWPTVNLLTIHDGWNVLDDNLLACPRDHFEAVVAMLRRQKLPENGRVEFSGGLEALSLQDWHVDLLASLKPRPNCFFAYDPGDAFETLESAARRMLAAGFTAGSHRLRTFVLIGYPKDTIALAEARLLQMSAIGFTPFAMLWRPETPSQQRHAPGPEWKRFQKSWARPAIIHARAA